MANFSRFQLPALLFALAIFLVSSLPSSYIPEWKVNWGDKVAHTVEYGLLGFLLGRALYFQTNDRIRHRLWLLGLLLGGFYGLVDELHQAFVPGRTASVLDLSADVIGVAFGLLLFQVWRPLEEKYLPESLRATLDDPKKDKPLAPKE